MRISGHGLRDYFRLLAPSFGLITAVFILRLVLDAARAPSGLVRVCSVTVAGAVAILVAVLMIHNRRFGGYPNVVVAVLFLVVWQQLLISGAIAVFGFTGIQNIYSAPEYSGGTADPWHHIAGHLTFGLGFGVLFGAAIGCLWLWIIRRLVPVEQAK
jgi:hypothetical protein